MLQRFLLLWLTLLSTVAYLWPSWADASRDPFALSADYLSQLFAVTMFAVGCILPRDEVRQLARRWPTVLGGTAIQYTLMPLLAYGFACAIDLTGDVFLGVMLVGCVPGAMASNVLTLSARGNVSYSVSLTTSATLLSPLVVPAMLYFAVDLENIDRFALMERAFRLLILQVVGPVVLGHLLSQRFTQLERFMHRCGPAIANLSILWIIAVVVNGNHENLSKVGWPLAAALLGINLLGFVGGYSGGSAMRVTDGMRRALTLEVGMQNAGLGSVLATQLFKDHNLVALPPALYTFGCMLTGAIIAQYWSQRSPAETDGVTTVSGEE